MHLPRDIFHHTRSPPPPRRTPSFLVSYPSLSPETTRRASLASSQQPQTYFHASTRYACLSNHRTLFLRAVTALTTTTQGAITRAALALLLHDAATLLRPPLVAGDEEECVPALRALSDLHALFKPRSPRATAKIVFYAAQVHRASASASFLLRGLQADVEHWAMKLEKKGESDEEDEKKRMTTTETQETVLDKPPPGNAQERPLIVEIS